MGIPAVCLASCGLLFVLVGCSFRASFKHGKPADPAAAISFWNPHLLFIQSEPYARLHVEVDAVEGVIPEDDNLTRLHDFLAAHCDKPAGIQIVRDSLIRRDQARGVSPEALAREFMSGPGDERGLPPAAFMYVLFYDNGLASGTETNATQTASRDAPHSSPAKPAQPHASLLPYPAAIFVDPTIWGIKRPGKVALPAGTFLQHEAGHLLGIGRNPAHSARLHCLNASCLMFAKYESGELLLQEFAAGIPDFNEVPRLRLCAECEADARAYASQPGPANLRFVGPVLVRLEDGYQVLALPDRLKVIVGPFCETDAWDFARSFQKDADVRTGADPVFASGMIKPEARQDLNELRRTLKQVRQDPLEVVRRSWR